MGPRTAFCQLLQAGAAPAPADLDQLFAQTVATPLHQALFPDLSRSRSLLEARWAAWEFLRIHRFQEKSVPLSAFEIWSFPLAIAQALAATKNRVIGIAGPPGCGKTTLALLLAECLQALDRRLRVERVSLDDFYLGRAERTQKGLNWRALPGSHDISQAVRLLTGVHARETRVEIPSFDPARDEPATPRQATGPLSFLILEGWIVGHESGGYGAIRKLLSTLIYLDFPLALARRRRFLREAALRRATGNRGGFSRRKMSAFWRDVLGPGIAAWVVPIRSAADLVIHFDPRGTIREATARVAKG